ncbi:MAG: glycogen synthase [Clostridia bacterium]|nr:glycogen synthase [Clostridia bacterium]
MSKILFVAAEAVPFASTGGLGDVIGSLPEAIVKADKSADVRVVLPLHEKISAEHRAAMTKVCEFTVALSWRNLYCGIWSLKKGGVTYYFIDNEYYFKRARLYGEFDDAERYAYFSKAAIDMLPHIGFYPDILHAHDWQAAMAVIYLRRQYSYPDIHTVYTIHNIEYQGVYSFSILSDVLGLSEADRDIIEYHGDINFTKGAIVCCDKLTTVSQKYSEEIRTPFYSYGLYHVINRFSFKTMGIVNGIDYKTYNPAADPDIPANFSYARNLKNKTLCKITLQEKVGLTVSPDTPMVAMITRLASHKGLDLVKRVIDEALATEDMQFVLLGTGEKDYEVFFKELENRFPGKVRALLEFNKKLSKEIYAAADLFLMPSKSEPCGLSQMMASRYGTVAIVRETGGLYDTIKPFDHTTGEGNGVTFVTYNAHDMLDAIRRALALYRSPDFKKLRRNAMTTDFSWEISAKRYLAMYSDVLTLY